MRLRFLLTLLTIVTLSSAMSIAAPAAPLVIYLAPTGIDTNSGLSATSPIKSLDKALDLATSHRQSTDSPVHVFFAKGTYYGLTKTWRSFSKTYSTLFAPMAGLKTGDVILDGKRLPTDAQGSTGGLFSFRLPAGTTAGQRTNILIRDLVIRNYRGGIAFNGVSKDDSSSAISRNIVRECVFERIGNMYAPIGSPPSKATSVIAVVNSRDNVFMGNRFTDINNTNYADPENIGKPYGSALHAFYLAHHSSNNRIEGNRFERHQSGAAIKVRDNSNDNVIIRNQFTEMYPSRAIQRGCPKSR